MKNNGSLGSTSNGSTTSGNNQFTRLDDCEGTFSSSFSRDSFKGSLEDSKVMMSPLARKRRVLCAPDEDVKLAVWLRLRPINAREVQSSMEKYSEVKSAVSLLNATSAAYFDPLQHFEAMREAFVYDGCLGPDSTQDDVFDCVGKALVEHSLQGYNGTLLAYGQTSSGKTHTMVGEGDDGEDQGLTPRVVEALLHVPELNEAERAVAEPTTRSLCVTFLEIYNEKVRDLLNLDAGALRVRQHPITGVFVEGGGSSVVTRADEFKTLLKRADVERASACTKLNNRSSRSHMILLIHVNEVQPRLGLRKTSLVHMVDLAGSERMKMSGSSGAQLIEAQNINLSLTTLRRIIDALIEAQSGKKDSTIPPYRESMLTWLLADSLGGNSHTTMIATVTPSPDCAEDSLGTLRYAQRARMIINKVHVNSSNTSKMMEVLQSEVMELQQRLLRDTSLAENVRQDLSQRIALSEEVIETLRLEVGGEREKAREAMDELQRAMHREGTSRALEATAQKELSLEKTYRTTTEDRVVQLQAQLAAALVEVDRARADKHAAKDLVQRMRDDLEASRCDTDAAKKRIQQLEEDAEKSSVEREIEASRERHSAVAETEKNKAAADTLRRDYAEDVAHAHAHHKRLIEQCHADCDAEVASTHRELSELENRRRAQSDLWQCREGAYVEQIAQLMAEVSSQQETLHVMEEEKHFYIMAMKVGSDNERSGDQQRQQWAAEKRDLEWELQRTRAEHDDLRRWVQKNHFPHSSAAAVSRGTTSRSFAAVAVATSTPLAVTPRKSRVGSPSTRSPSMRSPSMRSPSPWTPKQ